MHVSWVQQAAILAMTITLGAGAVGVHAQGKAAADTADLDARAEAIYKRTCSMCHAMDGNSPLPNMSFTDGVWRHGTTVKEMTETISNGVPGTAMMPFKTQFTEDEIAALARYVRKFDKKLK